MSKTTVAIRHDVVISTLWHRLVGLFRDVEATPWGGLLLGNAWPAYLFALPLLVRAWNLLRSTRADTLHDQAVLLQETVTVVFLAWSWSCSRSVVGPLRANAPTGAPVGSRCSARSC